MGAIAARTWRHGGLSSRIEEDWSGPGSDLDDMDLNSGWLVVNVVCNKSDLNPVQSLSLEL